MRASVHSLIAAICLSFVALGNCFAGIAGGLQPALRMPLAARSPVFSSPTSRAGVALCMSDQSEKDKKKDELLKKLGGIDNSRASPKKEEDPMSKSPFRTCSSNKHSLPRKASQSLHCTALSDQPIAH